MDDRKKHGDLRPSGESPVIAGKEPPKTESAEDEYVAVFKGKGKRAERVIHNGKHGSTLACPRRGRVLGTKGGCGVCKKKVKKRGGGRK